MIIQIAMLIFSLLLLIIAILIFRGIVKPFKNSITANNSLKILSYSLVVAAIISVVIVFTLPRIFNLISLGIGSGLILWLTSILTSNK